MKKQKIAIVSESTEALFEEKLEMMLEEGFKIHGNMAVTTLATEAAYEYYFHILLIKEE